MIDAGCGMEPEALARAVEPFYSTKEMGQGTGLGLSMVHGLTAQLGGGFALTSAPGEGTQVDLYFPVSTEAATPPRSRRIEPSRSVDRQLTVLLVDDEQIVRTATAEMIRDLGHEVHEAASGPEALAHLDAGLDPDILVTDYMMPGMDGGVLAQEIGRTHPGIAVLLITGYTGGSDDVLHLHRLAKPFGRAELGEAIADLMGGSKVIRFPSAKAAPPL